jgi:2-polyprenyl-3-methyl-5-hydroxy-6-metoxy-1,4-benzoquinol methylase
MNHCAYCKGSNSKIKFQTYDIFGDIYTINQCEDCHAFFLAPNPTPEQLMKAYDSSYYGEKEEKFNGFVEKILDSFRKKRAKLVSSYMKPNANILDIGCGNGRFLKFLDEFGNYHLFGIEMEGNSARRAAKIKNINLKIGTLSKEDFSHESFDVITMFHVFEHLQEPIEYLHIIKNILKKDGFLIMSFPNIDSWQAKIFKGKWLHLDPPRHLFFFKPKDLTKIMNELGFSLENISYASIEQNPYGMQQSLLNCLLKKREVLFEHMKGNHNYTKEYSKFSIMLQNIFFKTTFPFFIISDWIASFFKHGATVQMIFRKTK